jgi:hypothetical protein
MDLHKMGLSLGEIVKRLWREHGMARPTSAIEGIIGRENKKKIRNANSDN